MTNKKMTRRDYFNGLLGVLENHKDSIENYEEFKAFIEREIELLNKKRSNSKPTKTQIENEKIKEKILEVLTDVNEVMTISELMTANGLENYSNQKLSVLCHQLVNEHKVVNTKVKKVSYFKIA
jgi:hypothetical protein|nr:MAG TPA: hypothetical protein [Caudoviricetes sp.]